MQGNIAYSKEWLVVVVSSRPIKASGEEAPPREREREREQ
jgi:hypothetical protein